MNSSEESEEYESEDTANDEVEEEEDEEEDEATDDEDDEDEEEEEEDEEEYDDGYDDEGTATEEEMDEEEEATERLVSLCEKGLYHWVVHDYENGARDPYNEGMNAACRNGYFKIVKYLLAKNRNRVELTGFCKACEHGRFAIVRHMLKVETRRQLENYGMYWAAKGGYEKIVRFLMSKGATNFFEAFRGACEGGSVSIMQLMMDKGCNWYDGTGIAIAHDSIECLDVLLRKQCSDPNVNPPTKLNPYLKPELKQNHSMWLSWHDEFPSLRQELCKINPKFFWNLLYAKNQVMKEQRIPKEIIQYIVRDF